LLEELRREVEKHSGPVTGDLRSAIDNSRYPIAAAVKRASEISNLLEAADVETPVGWLERFLSKSLFRNPALGTRLE